MRGSPARLSLAPSQGKSIPVRASGGVGTASSGVRAKAIAEIRAKSPTVRCGGRTRTAGEGLGGLKRMSVSALGRISSSAWQRILNGLMIPQ